MAQAGLALGDEIVALDGHDLRGARSFDLGGRLAVAPGTTLTFELDSGRSIPITAIARTP